MNVGEKYSFLIPNLNIVFKHTHTQHRSEIVQEKVCQKKNSKNYRLNSKTYNLIGLHEQEYWIIKLNGFLKEFYDYVKFSNGDSQNVYQLFYCFLSVLKLSFFFSYRSNN